MIEKLPHIYLKEKLGNLYKIFEVIKDEIVSVEEITHEVENQDELNSATGISLDKHGELVGQRRAYLDDKSYRLLIKSRIRQNLSGGDIPAVNEFFTLILKDNYLGIKEGWNNSKYDNEPALIVFRYVHEIIEGGIEPVASIKLDDSADLDGEYSLDGKLVGYFDSEIINFAKSLAKKVVAAGVRVLWETPITVEFDNNPAHNTSFLQSNNFETNEIGTLDGDLSLDGSINLEGGIVIADHKATLSIYESGSLTEEVSI